MPDRDTNGSTPADTPAVTRPLGPSLPILILLALVTACGAALPGSGGPQLGPPPRGGEADARGDTIELVLAGTTDVSGWLYAFDYETERETDHGLARLKPIVDSLRAAHPGRVYLFDSGGYLEGTAVGLVYARVEPPAAEHAAIQAMHQMGYSAAAIGDRDFDHGLDVLERAVAHARFPILAGNVYFRDTGEHAYRPYALIPHEVAPGDTLLIGVTASTPPSVRVRDRARIEGILEIRDAPGSLAPIVEEMRARGADLVVVAAHDGLGPDRADGHGPERVDAHSAGRLAREVPGIDVVFMGRTRREVADTVIDGVLLTQGPALGAGLAVATVRFARADPGGWRVVEKRGSILRSDGTPPDAAFLDSLRWEHERTLEWRRSAAPGEVAAAEPADGPGPATPRLRVLATSDFHGRLLPETHEWTDGRSVGGAATIAGYLSRERAGFDGPTVLLDGGDLMQGAALSNLSQGRATVEYYDLVGYHAAALGNHEFDWGLDVLAERLAEANFSWLAANLFVAGADTAPSWARPAALLDVEGLRVGVIGLITEEAPRVTHPAIVRGLEFRSLADAIDRWVPRLREEGADFVVVTAHAGAFCAEEGHPPCRGEIIDAAHAVRERPDLIVAGHTHELARTRVNGIPIVQAGAYGVRYGVVDLERVRSDSVEVRIRGFVTTYADRVRPDDAVAAAVGAWEEEVGSLLEQVVATLGEPLHRRGGDAGPGQRSGEYALGRVIADAHRAAGGTPIAIMNNGGIRTDLPAGPVTWGTLLALQPFDNRLVRLRLTGAQILEALELALAGEHPMAHVSGMQVRYDPAGEPGRRIVHAELDDGTRLRPDTVYEITVNDFMADGGDGYEMFTRALGRESIGVSDIDALVAYLRTLPQPIRGPAAPRLVPQRQAEAAR